MLTMSFGTRCSGAQPQGFLYKRYFILIFLVNSVISSPSHRPVLSNHHSESCRRMIPLIIFTLNLTPSGVKRFRPKIMTQCTLNKFPQRAEILGTLRRLDIQFVDIFKSWSLKLSILTIGSTAFIMRYLARVGSCAARITSLSTALHTSMAVSDAM